VIRVSTSYSRRPPGRSPRGGFYQHRPTLPGQRTGAYWRLSGAGRLVSVQRLRCCQSRESMAGIGTVEVKKVTLKEHHLNPGRTKHTLADSDTMRPPPAFTP
jgi:hypothetical protein